MNKFNRTFGFINRHPLAKQHLLRAYSRFILWQFRSVFADNLIPVDFIGSTKVYAKRGLNGITGSIYTGLHEFEEMGFLLHLLRDTDIFFDVGANVGSYTILASGVCKSMCVSFEPVPGTFEIMKKNIELNHLQKKVKAINVGVGNEQKYLQFTSGQDTTNHVVSDSDNAADIISVPIVNLDEFLTEFPLLLKMDVEGFETEVIRGAQLLLKQASLKAIIIELNGSGERYNFDENLIHIQLTQLGFMPYQYDPLRRQLNKLQTYGKSNTIYLRDLSFIKERLKSAKPFKVFSQTI